MTARETEKDEGMGEGDISGVNRNKKYNLNIDLKLPFILSLSRGWESLCCGLHVSLHFKPLLGYWVNDSSNKGWWVVVGGGLTGLQLHVGRAHVSILLLLLTPHNSSSHNRSS